MTTGAGFAFASFMALIGWVVWLYKGWPKSPFDK